MSWSGGRRILHLDAVLPTRSGGACPDPIALYCGATLHGSNVGWPANHSTYRRGTMFVLLEDVPLGRSLWSMHVTGCRLE